MPDYVTVPIESIGIVLPRHINMTIEHQPHAVNYETVEEWLAHTVDLLQGADVLPEDRTAMLATGEVWVVHWYPNTPVGFCAVAAATLERALALALASG